MDITFATQHSRARPAQSLPTRCAGTGVEQWQIGRWSQCQAA